MFRGSAHYDHEPAGAAAHRGDRPLHDAAVPLERQALQRLRGGHHRLGTGRRGRARVLALHEIPPAPRHPHRRLLGPQPAGAGRRRPQRAGRPPPAGDGHGRAGPERVAVAAPRHQGGQRPGRALPHRRLLLQDVHAPCVAVAHLRAGAGHVRARRQDRPRHPPPLPRQALHASRRGGGRGRAGRNRSGPGRGRGRCPGASRGARARRGWPSALQQQRLGPGRAGRATSRTRRLRRGGSDRLHRHRPLRGQLARDRAAQPSDRGRAPHKGPGQGAGGGAGPDREALRVCGQRPSRGDHLGRGSPLDQPVGGQAGRAGGGVHGQLRRRRGRGRPRPGRGGDRRGHRRPRGATRQRRAGRAESAGGGRGRRYSHGGRPAGRGRGVDRPHVAAQHGRRPAHLRPGRRPVLPVRPARQRAGHGRAGRRRQSRRAARPRHGHWAAGRPAGRGGGPPLPSPHCPGPTGNRRRAGLGARRAAAVATGLPSGAVPLRHPRHGRLLRGRRLQGSRRRSPGGLRLGGAGQALHHRHHGVGPGQARDGQHRGGHCRGPRRDHRVRSAPRSGGLPTLRSRWERWRDGCSSR